MNDKSALALMQKISELQAIMAAYATDGRTSDQPLAYRDLYIEIAIELEEAKYANPNPHKSLEVFYSHCKLQKMKTYASRRVYIEDLYVDVLLDLKRQQKHGDVSKSWKKANDALADQLSPVRKQWLKAKNFIYGTTPDYENSIKESISAIESCLMILLDKPGGTLGKLIKQAGLDPDIKRLISQAYGVASNRDFVRHGGTNESALTKPEAIFFLELSATSIIYITSKLQSLAKM